ncbi:MAG: hypothetical protein LWW77_10535, partial [Propionibacteriales bacterium]|nr:hypothetical protein [Propionibacteriales bacterium]
LHGGVHGVHESVTLSLFDHHIPRSFGDSIRPTLGWIPATLLRIAGDGSGSVNLSHTDPIWP